MFPAVCDIHNINTDNIYATYYY